MRSPVCGGRRSGCVDGNGHWQGSRRRIVAVAAVGRDDGLGACVERDDDCGNSA
jgi:hypothetical protein